MVWKNQLASDGQIHCILKKISLMARNFDSEKIKVNDKKGNPIEISAVVVWKVEDTAEAIFEVMII